MIPVAWTVCSVSPNTFLIDRFTFAGWPSALRYFSSLKIKYLHLWTEGKKQSIAFVFVPGKGKCDPHACWMSQATSVNLLNTHQWNFQVYHYKTFPEQSIKQAAVRKQLLLIMILMPVLNREGRRNAGVEFLQRLQLTTQAPAVRGL